MTKATRIDFINDSNSLIKINAARGSEGQFEDFTLVPGEGRYLQKSKKGIDIEWDVIVNPGEPDREKLAGFEANNPWIGPCYLAAVSEGVWTARNAAQNDPIIFNGKSYKTQYYDSLEHYVSIGHLGSFERYRIQPSSMQDGESFAVGKVDEDKIYNYEYRDSWTGDFIQGHFTKGKLDGFDSSLPYATVEFLNDDSDSKHWRFVIEDF